MSMNSRFKQINFKLSTDFDLKLVLNESILTPNPTWVKSCWCFPLKALQSKQEKVKL